MSVNQNRVDMKMENGNLSLNIMGGGIIQVTFSTADDPSLFLKNNSLSVLDVETPKIVFDVNEEDNKIEIKTRELMIQFDKKTGNLRFLTDSGEKILQESARELELMGDEKKCGYSIKQYFKWTPNEALYGLGQHQDVDNALNYRGLDVHLYQDNIKVAVPVLLSSKGYGILWDNYSYTKFSDSGDDSYLWSEVADGINYYFLYGPEFDDIVKKIRFLTGKSPMFPKWFFGYTQCKERYKTAEELLGIVEEYRRREIPLDLIVQDWRYWGSILKWGNKTFTKRRYPRPTETIKKIHDLNAKVMISIWPLMSRITEDYKQMKKEGYLFDGGLFTLAKNYDAFNPDARDLYWKQAYEGLFVHGIDAWWCDSTEPQLLESAASSPPSEEFHQTRIAFLKHCMQNPSIGSTERYLNAYSLVHSKGIYEHQREVTSEKRVVNLTRSGFTGQQRFATVTWSGDVSATWNIFASQIPAGLNFCMTGNPYWTTDIGAFFTKSSKLLHLKKGDYPEGYENQGYREFYTRWFQFGAFSPMFRSHGTDTPREVWRFGEPGTMFYDTLLKFLSLRYRLLSYVYSVAGMGTHNDYTMMRSLLFDFRHDPHVFDIIDEYMFGPAFLVCPVLNPMYYNKESEPIEGVEKTRKLYLPAGTTWYDFWTGKQYDGGQTIIADAPIDILPLYIKAGSIIPFNPPMQYATEKAPDPLEIRIYPGADGEFTLYEDENDNYNYENGNCAFIPFTWNNSQNKLFIEKRKGEFPGMLEERKFNLVLINKEKGAGLEDIIDYDKTILYDGAQIEITLK